MRVIVQEDLLTNIRNSFSVTMVTTTITVIISALAAFSIVRYRYRGREWIGRFILFKYLLPTAMLFIPLYAIVTAMGLGNTQQALILTYLTFTIPFLGCFRGMPSELEEQAMVVGLHRRSTYYDCADQALYDGSRQSVYLGPINGWCGARIHSGCNTLLHWAAVCGPGPHRWYSKRMR